MNEIDRVVYWHMNDSVTDLSWISAFEQIGLNEWFSDAIDSLKKIHLSPPSGVNM